MRGRVILIESGRVALIKRIRNGQTYYIFPGGGAEEGETPEQAAIREAFEELGLRVVIGRLVAVQSFAGVEHYFYLAACCGGTFGTGCGPEYSEAREPGDTLYEPHWLPIEVLAGCDIRPQRLARALVSGEVEGWHAQRIEEA